MAGGRQPVRIAINVMRARLTVVGFNLAIITFQLSAIGRLPGAVTLPNLDLPVHLESDIALLIGLGLSVMAMICFIASSAFDHEGMCTHWSLLAGDLLMYLGLAQSVAGFFGPMIATLDQAALDLPDQITELSVTRLAVGGIGGVAWLSAVYLGPAVTLMRSPFGWRITVSLGAGYLLLLLAVAYVSAQASRLEVARAGLEPEAPSTLLDELVQPLWW